MDALTAPETGLDCLRDRRVEPEGGMNPFEFRLIRDYIHDYCGIFFDDPKAPVLASRLSFRMRLLGIRSYVEYYNYLRFNPRSKEEMEDLIPHLTNNETYFFRELTQISHLVEGVARKAKDGGLGRSFRVLSCGCSSGEEAFTLALMLEEAGVFRSGMEVEITGIDIDRKVLEKASAAEYTSYSMRATSKSWLDRYFIKRDDRYLLDERIKRRVSFRRGNLFDPETFARFKGGVDAILCRNVFIYFSDAAIKRIVETFHDSLVDNGTLMLGHSESLSRITDIFYPERLPNIIVYTKKT